MSYLHVGVVGRPECLVNRRGTAPLTTISVESFGIDDPVTPVELLEVHPHVHPPAETTLSLLCCSFAISLSLLGLLMSLLSASPHLEGGLHGLPAHVHILGVLCCVNQRQILLVVEALLQEDHHHHPVRSGVLGPLLRLLHAGLIRRPLSRGSLLEPALERLRYVEDLPGGGRDHRAGVGSEASQEQLVLGVVCTRVLVLVGVVDVHRGTGGLGEGW